MNLIMTPLKGLSKLFLEVVSRGPPLESKLVPSGTPPRKQSYVNPTCRPEVLVNLLSKCTYQADVV